MDVLARNHVQVLPGDGPVLLYAHGFGCNQTMWRGITPAFEATHKQVLFDYVGSGHSDLSAFDERRYGSLDGYALDLIEVCDALGLRGVTFVGHSVSCSIGLLASIARPELFDRLVLLGPSPCFLNHPPDYVGGFAREDLEDLLSLMDQNYMGWAAYLAPVAAGESGDNRVAAELADSFCTTDPVVARTFAQATFFADNRSDLARVTRPCLILQHRHDVLAPVSVGDFVHDQIKGSTLQVLEVSGHCCHLSQPRLVIDAMRNYLQASA